MANFYISDLHFGHKNVIKFDNRPFFTISEMNKSLIKNWNKKVTDNDTVYILGDFSWLPVRETVDILKQLAGRKILIKGNHDRISPQVKEAFNAVYDYLEIMDNGTKVVLSHYPILSWNGQFFDSVHLYGHLHNSHQWHLCEKWAEEGRLLQAIPIRMINVGCMMPWMDYTPQTLDTILAGYNEFLQKQKEAHDRLVNDNTSAE